jgi:hypothetical protein
VTRSLLLQIFEEDPVNDQEELVETLTLAARQLRASVSSAGLSHLEDALDDACARALRVLRSLQKASADSRWVGGVLFHNEVFHGVLSCVLAVSALSPLQDARTADVRRDLSAVCAELNLAQLRAPIKLRDALLDMHKHIST